MLSSDVRYVKWEPIEGIDQPCGLVRIVDHESGYGLTLLLSLYDPELGAQKWLRLIFEDDIVAVSAYEEFAHPIMDHAPNSLPRFKNKTAFPCLEVLNSAWIASFSELRRVAFGGACRHYCFVSHQRIVDVLTFRAVHAEWVPVE
ncbi:MAG: hypothetical protein RhofKO_33330 [Rhodothermales bacterium]